MSTSDTLPGKAHLDAHGEDTRHVHSHDDGLGAAHGSFKGYLLSVVLTAIPFWLVMGEVLPSKTLTVMLVLAFGGVQVLVHMVYFLHLNTRSEGGWNMLALIFTLILVLITFAGSLWVMYHLNDNMMPLSVHEARNLP